MGREIKFKPATFYLGIADHLARVVEGQQPEEGEPRPEELARRSSEERRERERVAMADSLGKGELSVESAGAVEDVTGGGPGASASTTTTQGADAPVAVAQPQPQPQMPLLAIRCQRSRTF